MPDFDFTAFVATPRYYPHGRDVFAPRAFIRPDGTCFTMLGHVYACLLISGNRTLDIPLDYNIKIRDDHKFSSPSGKSIDIIFTKPTVPLFTARLAELQSLVGDPVPPPEPKPPVDVKCHDCRGSGKSFCPHCDQLMECEECGGSGTMRDDADPDEGIPIRYLRVNGTYYNATAFAPLVAGLPDCEIELRETAGSSAGRLLVNGDGWTLLVQGLVPGARIKDGATVVDFLKPEPVQVESA